MKGAFDRHLTISMRMPLLRMLCGPMAAANAAICAAVQAAARDAAVVSDNEHCNSREWHEEVIKGAFKRHPAIDMRIPQLRGGKRAK